MLRVCLCLSLLGGVIGCGGGGGIALPKTVPAGGTITLDGKPLESASVTFSPKGTTKGIECVGVTDAAGKYKLKQIRGGDGVPPGEYAVIVNRYVKPDGTPVPLDGTVAPADLGAVESLPPQYSNPTEPSLAATVPEKGGEFNFDLLSQ